jgi:hypothetical protein
MTDEEADDLYRRLLSELRRRRDDEQPEERDDYLRAIEADIDAGKSVQVTLKVRGERTVRDPVAGTRRAEATSSGEFIQRQEYTAKEKLEILIDGLGLATVAPPLMARKVFEIVGQLDENVATRGFQMGDDQTADARRTLNMPSIDAAVAATAALHDLLSEVRHELSDRSSSSVPSSPERR